MKKNVKNDEYSEIQEYKKICSRKEQHIEISLKNNVELLNYSWFRHINLVHQSLPEINMNEIDYSLKFINFKLKSPIMISALTGGTQRSLKINEELSKIAEDFKIAMMVGSQRIALEHPKCINTFSVVRKYAHNIPIIANIGIQQLIEYNDLSSIEKIIDMIKADAISIHLNALQECIQPEGETDFKGGMNKIIELKDQLSIPIIIKETGAGISKEIGMNLIKNGLKIFDVSGVGGTSFSLIEQHRLKLLNNIIDPNYYFDDYISMWGIPTPASISELRHLSSDIQIIGSGGIRTGLDIAKSIAIGANLTGIGLPILKTIINSPTGTKNYIKRLNKELRIAMFLTGCENLEKLRNAKKVILPPLKTWLEQRNQ